MSIRTKLWIYFIVCSILSTILFVVGALVFGSITFPGQNLNSLDAIRKEALSAIDKVDPAYHGGVEFVLERLAAQHTGVTLEWIDVEGAVIYSSAGRTEPYVVGELASTVSGMPYDMWTEGEHVALVTETNWSGRPHFLMISLPTDIMQRAQVYFYVIDNAAFYQLVVPFLLFFLTPFGFTMFFLSRMNRRLRKLNRAMNSFDVHDSETPIVDLSRDEIGQLAQHFNAMARRIKEQVTEIQSFESRRKELMSNLSHDLRTPLTTIMGYAETIRSGVPNARVEDVRQFTGIILQRSQYMSEILDVLLDISRLESGGFDLKFEDVNLSELLRRIVADYVLIAEEKGVAPEIEIPEEDVWLRLDRVVLERAVRNLLDNALAHGSAGKFLGVTLAILPEGVHIRVRDRGQGIAAAEQQRIFDRLYRTGTEGRRDGLGIGLSVVKQVADAHGGAIYVSSLPGEETVFCLQLPRVTSIGAATAV